MKRLLLCLALVFGLAIPCHALKLTPEMDKTMKELEPIYEKEDDNKFVQLVEKKIRETAPENKERLVICYGYLVDAKSNLGDMEGAYAALDAAMRLAPENPVTLYYRAALLIRDGKGDEALQEWRSTKANLSEDERKDLDRTIRNTLAHSRKVTAAKLWKDFSENEVAAEDVYQNKLISVEGKVSRISTSPMGYPEVTFFVDRTGINAVVCQFGQDRRSDIAKLKKGQNVTIAGVCKAFTLGAQVSLNGCWLLK